jgi:hypothetical protein
MVTLADIKNDLPDWPDNVIQQWLVHLANRSDTGWPPPNPLGQHPWTHILGHRSLPWWREVTWELKGIDCSFPSLAQATQKIVNEVLADVTGLRPDPNTKGRFDEAFDYILNNGKFKEPLVTMIIPDDGISVIDGNHRISAFCGLQKMPPEQFEKLGLKKPNQIQQVWVGTHKDGGIPMD